MGAARGRPGGAPLDCVPGVQGRALSHPRPLVLSGVLPGPTTHWLWMRGVRAWGPVTNPTARALASWLCALWGVRRAPGADISCLGVGRPGSGARSPPTARPFGRAAGADYPQHVSAGAVGVGTRHQPTARALASWLCARSGWHEGAKEGCLLPGFGASGVGRSPTPDRSSFGACCRGPLPTGCGCGGRGRRDPSPAPTRALLRAGFAHCGGGKRAPGGGRLLPGYGPPGAGALPPPTARPFWRVARAHYPLAVGAGVVRVGTGHRPHSARSCELALRAVVAARGRPGGAPLAWVWGVRGWALSHPRPLVLWRVLPELATHSLWLRGVWARGPVTNPTARALASWLCALWGWHESAPGKAPLACVWGVWGRALSHPRPPVLWGVRPGPATHWLWSRCEGVWARLSMAPSPVPRFVVCCARFPRLRHPVDVVAPHLSSCFRSGRRPASLACLVATRWCAAPRPVRLLSVLRSAFPSPWCLPPTRGLLPPALPGACAGHVEAGREPGSWCLPLAPAEARALGALSVVPVRGPAMGLSLTGLSGFGLWLRALRWLACDDPVTDASGFLYCPGDSAGAPGLFRVDADTSPFGSQDATLGSCTCLCTCSSWPGRAGRPPGRVLVRLTFSSCQSWCTLRLLNPLRALIALCAVIVGCFLLSFFFATLLSPAFRVFRPGVPWAWASCGPPPPLFFFPAPPVSCVRWFPARGAMGLCALWSSCVALLFACLFFFPPLLPPPLKCQPELLW